MAPLPLCEATQTARAIVLSVTFHREAFMRRVARVIVLLALSIGFGFAVGRTQTTEPDFELVVTAPAGETKVECRRGCGLAWVERGLALAAKPSSSFTFECSGADVARCSSARIGGWVRR